jgi:hypothetical protein
VLIAEAGNWRLVNRYDDSDHTSPGFRQILALSGPLTLARRMNVDAARRMLQLQFGRLGEPAGQVRFEVWINGTRLLRETPELTASSTEPLRFQIPLEGITSASIEVSVRMSPVGSNALVDWRGATLVRDGTGG